ncbi:MAG: SLBB domain-containing protein [Bryobacteraceae bacterium]|nr:SLBB domain-containing protein [Bryobacteraceae bacterium]
MPETRSKGRSTPPSKITLDRIAELGVVGAGGAGFPSAVKFSAQVSTVIVNGAECEPLLHKDKELLHHRAAPMLAGLRAAVELTGASEAVIGIKEKYTDVIDAITPLLTPGIRVQRLRDTYPAGDEFVLVYDVTGKVIPPGGLPKDVGAVVTNVETLVNIGQDKPVTRKYLTVAGAVREPVTLSVPVGMSIGEVIEAAGGSTVADFGVLLGGVMMGRLAENLDVPVTKTLGGIIVLPKSHHMIQWYSMGWKQVEKIGRSACDQCRFCTELCPRYLLGHPIQPHRAMQSLGFVGDKVQLIASTLYCCECNICSLIACPENLDPKTVCVQAKPAARENKLFWNGDTANVQPHPMQADRRIPMRRLISKLGLTEFRNVGPLVDRELTPRSVTLPLKQHTGAPAVAVVAVGSKVKEGDLLAAPAAGALGARIHASIAGVVRRVDGESVTIEA